jgi:hypothetical protein
MKRLWTRHKIYPVTDYVNLWPLNVTLTLVVGDRLLRMTHCLIIVNNCGKYLQNPFKDKKVLDRTRHIPSNRQCWPWMSKCDLDHGGRGLGVVHDTSFYYNKDVCQVISDSFGKWKSYGPGTKVGRTDGRTDNAKTISPSRFHRRGITRLYLCVKSSMNLVFYVFENIQYIVIYRYYL